MSRSRRKHPYAVVMAMPRESLDKRFVHQAERRAVKIALQTGREVLPHIREVRDVWSKDGKQWIDARRDPRILRK